VYIHDWKASVVAPGASASRAEGFPDQYVAGVKDSFKIVLQVCFLLLFAMAFCDFDKFV